jgi:hypothetical protein
MNRARLGNIAASLSGTRAGAACRLLEALLSVLPRKPGDRSLKVIDGGYIMSLAGRSTAVRFFDSLNCDTLPLPPGKKLDLLGGRVAAFAELCALANQQAGTFFDREFAASLEGTLHAGAAIPGWALFGAKLAADRPAELTLYLIDTPWKEETGWGCIKPLLDLFGISPASLARQKLRGVYDCAGIALGPSGEKKLKVYTRFPVPSAGDLAALKKIHGAAGGEVLAACAALEKSCPARHWTNAYRYAAGRAAPISVKTEVHFKQPVPAGELAGLLQLAPDAPDAGFLVSRRCSVTTLAVEKGRLTVYFTC